MSYAVSHHLSLIIKGEDYEAFEKLCENSAEKVVEVVTGKKYLFFGEGVYEDEIDRAMSLVSKKFPGTLFKIRTEWEQGMGGEVTEAYYRDGKQTRYKETRFFQPFKEEDLV